MRPAVVARIETPPPVSGPCPGLDKASKHTYYVCDCGAGAAASCRPGDDLAEGSVARPFRSYEQARRQFATIDAGDAIAFCRGGSFTVPVASSQRWVNERCRASQPCIVRDYSPSWAPPDAAPPIISAPPKTGVFSFDNGGNARHEEGYTFANLDLEGSGSGWAFFAYNDIDDVNICHLTINRFDIAVHVGDANALDPGSDGRNDRIALRDSRITNNAGQGWLGASTGSSIEGCLFSNNGYGRAILNHNIYLSGHPGTSGMRVVGNRLLQSAVVDRRCQGTSLVVHGTIDHLTIEDNEIVEERGAAADTCWGIGVVPGNGDPELFNDVHISRNRITNVGNVSIAVSACHACAIENNVIINEQGFNDAAIQVPAIAPLAGDATDDRILIRNNSIYIDSGTGIALGKAGSGHVVANNAILSSGRRRSQCFDLGLPAAAYDEVDYNVCFLRGEGDWAAGRGSLASWRRDTTFDAHSAFTAPEFTSVVPPHYDLTPAAKSPLIDRGDPRRSSAVDVTGKPRTDGAPDIGAIER